MNIKEEEQKVGCSVSRLLFLEPIDAPDDLETYWSDCFKKKIWPFYDSKTEDEFNTAIQQQITMNPSMHNDIVIGLLFGLLTNYNYSNNYNATTSGNDDCATPLVPNVPFVITGHEINAFSDTSKFDSRPYWRTLTLIVRDSFANCIHQLKQLIHSKFHKILFPVTTNLLILIHKLIELRVKEIDVVFQILLRHVISGLNTFSNQWLWFQILNMIQKHKDFFFSVSTKNVAPQQDPNDQSQQQSDQANLLLCSVLYACLSQLNCMAIDGTSMATALFPAPAEDLAIVSSLYNKNKQMMNEICLEIMNSHFEDSISIGRDLLRLLDKSFPEKFPIWFPNHQIIQQVASRPTKRKVFQTRITPEMEKQLLFLMTQVKMGNQRRYQLWFQASFLNNNQNLILDLIRYICCYFHPTNQVLREGFVSRWAMLGWLLKLITVTNKRLFFQAHLSVVLDWICYHPTRDTIMNIEPAILLMIHSLAKYFDVTTNVMFGLLKNSFSQFNNAAISQNEPEQSYLSLVSAGNPQVLGNLMLLFNNNIKIGVGQLLEKGVTTKQSLAAIGDAPAIDANLRKCFSSFLSSSPPSQVPPTPLPPSPVSVTPTQPTPVTQIQQTPAPIEQTQQQAIAKDQQLQQKKPVTADSSSTPNQKFINIQIPVTNNVTNIENIEKDMKTLSEKPKSNEDKEAQKVFDDTFGNICTNLLTEYFNGFYFNFYDQKLNITPKDYEFLMTKQQRIRQNLKKLFDVLTTFMETRPTKEFQPITEKIVLLFLGLHFSEKQKIFSLFNNCEYFKTKKANFSPQDKNPQLHSKMTVENIYSSLLIEPIEPPEQKEKEQKPLPPYQWAFSIINEILEFLYVIFKQKRNLVAFQIVIQQFFTVFPEFGFNVLLFCMKKQFFVDPKTQQNHFLFYSWICKSKQGKKENPEKEKDKENQNVQKFVIEDISLLVKQHGNVILSNLQQQSLFLKILVFLSTFKMLDENSTPQDVLTKSIGL